MAGDFPNQHAFFRKPFMNDWPAGTATHKADQALKIELGIRCVTAVAGRAMYRQNWLNIPLVGGELRLNFGGERLGTGRGRASQDPSSNGVYFRIVHFQFEKLQRHFSGRDLLPKEAVFQ